MNQHTSTSTGTRTSAALEQGAEAQQDAEPRQGAEPLGAHRLTGVVVVGSVNADLLTTVALHPRPGETVLGRTLDVLPGGKGANQAVAAARLGAATTFVGAVGTDQFAGPALVGLRSAAVDLDALAVVEGATGVAQVTVAADGENAIVVIPGANAQVDGDAVDARAAVVAEAAVVVVQGEIPRSGVEAAARHARGRLVVNLAPVIDVDRDVLTAADPLVVNEHEAALVLAALDAGAGEQGSVQGAGGPDGVTADEVLPARAGGPEVEEERVVTALLAHGVRSVVLTVGARGALVADGSRTTRVPSPRVDAVDTTGAGDAFVGALAFRLSEGDGLVEAAHLAARVGAYAVRGSGAQPSYPWSGDALPEVEDVARAGEEERTRNSDDADRGVAR